MNRTLNRLSDYSDESLLKEVRRIASLAQGHRLTIDFFERNGRCSYAIIKNRFGGISKALQRAGMDSGDFHRNVPDKELLRELKRIWDIVLQREGRRPYKRDLVKYRSAFSQGPYYRRWGSWIRACEALLEWEEEIPSINVSVADRQLQKSKRLVKKPIPLRIRYAILMRDRFTCRYCGRSPSTTQRLEVDVDHIIPESKGGTLDPNNLQTLCRECNIGKGNISEW